MTGLSQEDQNTNYAGNTGVTVLKYCVGSQTVNMRSGNQSICGLMRSWSPCR